MPHLFTPQEPDTVRNFMESVQPKDTIGSHIKQTTYQVGRTLGAVATSPIAVAAAGVESVSYASANAAGIVPVAFNKVGKLASSARSKLKSTFSPNSTAA